jgi:hypothetical protein
MLGWGTIAYGAAISALLAAAGVFVFGNERRGRVAVTAGLMTGLGVAGWDTVVRVTQSTGMLMEAPFPAFPISWQDGGCGLAALAFTTVVLGCGLRRSAKAVHLVLLGLLCGVAALLTGVYFA